MLTVQEFTLLTSFITMVVRITGVQSINGENEVEDCGLWLGVSSLNSNRLSVFAGRDYQEGEGILSIQENYSYDHNRVNTRNEFPGELGIPLIDLDHQNRFMKNDFNKDMDEFLNACWSGELTGMDLIEGEHEVYTAISGLGMLVGEHKSVTNVDWDHNSLFSSFFIQEQTHKDEINANIATMTSSSKGAMTKYNDFRIKAKRFIPSGMELFIEVPKGDDEDGGDNYMDSSSEVDTTSFIPSTYYEIIDQAMNHIHEFFQNREFSKGKEQEIYRFLIEKVIPFVVDGIEYGDDDNVHNYVTKITSLFPSGVGKLQAVQKSGGSLINHYPKMLKSQVYLEKNAQCMDRLYADTSTIPNAGYGAFAKSYIAKGNLIAPMPVLKILGKDYLKFENENHNHTTVNARQQLLLNYCFGHPESSLLLFPYGAFTNYINNAPKPNQVNAKIIWTKSSYSHHETLHKLSIQEMKDEQYTKNHPIGFDIIATKDIMPGDEILLNYGLQWKKAWKDHNLNYTRDNELNKAAYHGEDNLPFATKDELEQLKLQPDSLEINSPSIKLLPDHVQIVCFILLTDYDEKRHQNENHDFQKDDYEKWHKKGFSVSEMDPDIYFDHERIIRGSNLFPCDLLERSKKDETFYYTVQLTHEDDDEENNDMIIINLPHHLITYTNKPYTSEMHWNGAFRHAIGIPNDLFPDAWRDLI